MNSPTNVTSALPLSDRAIRAAQPGDVLRDTVVRGLHLRCFPESKAFYLYYRSKAGQQRKPKLGDYGSITLARARKAAQELLAQVAAGRDPAQERREQRAELTVTQLWDEFYRRRATRNKTANEQERCFRKYIEPRFGAKRLGEVTYRGVADMMSALAATPYVANRCLSLLSAMFNFAVQPLDVLEKNPCRGVERYPEVKRRRYMRGEEAARIAERLDAAASEHPESVAFLYLVILSGARKSEIANARWEWLRGNVLELPDSKTGAKSIYLPAPAMDVLARLPRTSGTITGIADPKKLWGRIRQEAGCPDLRIHDLRHSFASAALAAGLELSAIGELLGHKSVQTTKRYAHLVEEAAQASVMRAADQIMLSMKKEPV